MALIINLQISNLTYHNKNFLICLTVKNIEPRQAEAKCSLMLNAVNEQPCESRTVDWLIEIL